MKVLFVLCFAWLLVQDDPAQAKKDLASFQGKWKLVSAIRDGKKMSPEEAGKISLVIKGDKFVLKKNGTSISEGTLTLDAAKTPKEIDETISSGANKGKLFRAIYEVDEMYHKICFAAPGNKRPKTFASEPGSNQLLQVWKRAK